MSKQTILVTSLNIFAHFGIKGVSMSQIANSIRVSKRTLYSYFGSKEELLCACMDYEDANISALLDGLEKQIHHPVNRIVSLTIKMNRYRSSYCPAFYKDIVQFENANLKLNETYGHIRKRFTGYFEEGVKQGFFLPNHNYEVMTYLLIEQMVVESKSRMSSLHRSTAFFTFLRGLCTEKGLWILEQLAPAENEKCVYEYDIR